MVIGQFFGFQNKFSIHHLKQTVWNEEIYLSFPKIVG